MNESMINESITLSRACEAVEIPSGIRYLLPMGTVVRISQSLGDSYTVVGAQGMFRIPSKDADALGFSIDPGAPATEQGRFSEDAVWGELRTIFDPEIPVNIADLGLIYSCAITPLDEFSNRVEIKMSLTAPGCGMADVLKEDVERKLSRLPGVKEVHVEVVFDPPWEASRMSEGAKLQLGLDLDFSPSPTTLPILKPGRFSR